MSKLLLAIIAAGTLFAAGCSTPPQSSDKWEYKAALTPLGPEGRRPVSIERREQFLNDLARNGWILVSADGDLFYMKRAKK